jgi:4-amino-4-deoxy-L-arabinose transferase-like glycosyltransferase
MTEPSTQQFVSPRNRQWFVLLVGVILVGAFVVRFAGLKTPDLWIDETTGYWTAHRTVAEILTEKARPTGECQPDPPLHVLSSKVLLPKFGRTEGERELPNERLRFRLPAAATGWLAAALVLLLGVSLFGRRAGLVAGALMAFLYYPVYYSREARPYAWVMFFSVVAALAWWRQTRAPRHNWPWFVMGLALAGAMYANYFAVFMLWIAAFWVALFVLVPEAVSRANRRTVAGKGALAIGLAALLYGPWWSAFFFVTQRHMSARHFFNHSGLAPIKGSEIGDFFLKQIGQWTMGRGWWAPGLVLATLGVWWLWRNNRPALLLLLPWLLAAVPIWPLVPGSKLVHFRYLIFSLPAYLMLVATGVAAVAGWVRGEGENRRRRLAAAVVWIALLAVLLLPSLGPLGRLVGGAEKCTSEIGQPAECLRFIE